MKVIEQAGQIELKMNMFPSMSAAEETGHSGVLASYPDLFHGEGPGSPLGQSYNENLVSEVRLSMRLEPRTQAFSATERTTLSSFSAHKIAPAKFVAK